MAKTVTYDRNRLMEMIKASEGLPENLSTEAQLWDEIFKKEAYILSSQFFPLIKEVHGKNYPAGTSIEPLATEYSVDHARDQKISSIRADITVIIDKKDIYHFECQIKNDGTMVLRMFEYDAHIALTYPSDTSSAGSDSPDASSTDSTDATEPPILLKFPHSAVLYLQDNGNIPDRLRCRIQFQDGSTYDYSIPTVKVQTYTLEEIQEKHLCILIPFLPLRFRKHMTHDKNTDKIHFRLSKEELTSFFRQLILILDEEVAGGYLTENNRAAILSLLRKSMIRVFYRDDTLIKEVINMTEPILELEIEKYIRQYEDSQQMLEHTSLELEQSREENSKNKAEIASLKAQLAKLQAQAGV